MRSKLALGVSLAIFLPIAAFAAFAYLMAGLTEWAQKADSRRWVETRRG